MLLWGSLFPMVKLGFSTYQVQSTADILLFAGIRFVICGGVICAFCVAKSPDTYRPAGKSMIPILLFAPHIVRILNDKPQVVEYGTLLLRVITPFFLVSCFSHLYSGALRGAGNSRAPMIIMLSTFVGARQLYLFIMSRVCNEVIPIALAYPVGWMLCSLATTIYYHRTKLDASRIAGKH